MVSATGVILLVITTVPANVVAAVEGCWNLGEGYRVTLRRTDAGLHVDQDAVTRLGKRDARDEPVKYEPRDNTLSFTGLGAIHRTVVMLRPSGTELEFVFTSEISPGKFTQGSWEKAQRCSAGVPK